MPIDAPQFEDLRHKLHAAKSPLFTPTPQEVSWAQTDSVENKGSPFWRGATLQGTALWRRAKRLELTNDVEGARALRWAAIGRTGIGIAAFPASIAAGIATSLLGSALVRSNEGVREDALSRRLKALAVVVSRLPRDMDRHLVSGAVQIGDLVDACDAITSTMDNLIMRGVLLGATRVTRSPLVIGGIAYVLEQQEFLQAYACQAQRWAQRWDAIQPGLWPLRATDEAQDEPKGASDGMDAGASVEADTTLALRDAAGRELYIDVSGNALCEQSSYFERLFYGPFESKPVDAFHEEVCDLDAARLALQTLMGASLAANSNNIAQLYTTFDRWGCEALLEACRVAMPQHVTAESIATQMAWAAQMTPATQLSYDLFEAAWRGGVPLSHAFLAQATSHQEQVVHTLWGPEGKLWVTHDLASDSDALKWRVRWRQLAWARSGHASDIFCVHGLSLSLRLGLSNAKDMDAYDLCLQIKSLSPAHVRIDRLLGMTQGAQDITIKFQSGEVSKLSSHILAHYLASDNQGGPSPEVTTELFKSAKLCEVYRFPPAPTGTVLLDNHEHLFLDMNFTLEGLELNY